MPFHSALKAASALPSFTLAAVLVTSACSKPDPQAPPPPEVSTVSATPVAVPLTRQLVGRLSAYRSADVRARVPGILQKRLYEEGTDISAEQPLFQIDPAPLQAATARAKAELQAARALQLNAHAAAERARSLAPQKFVSKADLDAAEAAERSAMAAVAQAQAGLASAQIDLGYARVRSPISGRAGKQRVTEGALVGSGDATLLTTVEQIDPLYVNLTISSADLEALREEQARGALSLSQTGDVAVRVIKADGSNYRHEAKLDFAAMDIDPSSGSVSLRAVLPNPERALLPGAFVSVEADLGSRADAYLIPQQALQRDKDGPFVMVVTTESLVARKDVVVEPRARDGQWVVTGGIARNDRVIALGLQSARAGEKVVAKAFKQATGGDASPAGSAAQN